MVTLIYRPEKDWLDEKVEKFMWRQLRHAYKVDNVIATNNIKFEVGKFRGEVICLEPTGDTMLEDLDHPDDAIYVFGNAWNHNKTIDGKKVRINTPSTTDMFAVNAAAITLASRYGNG